MDSNRPRATAPGPDATVRRGTLLLVVSRAMVESDIGAALSCDIPPAMPVSAGVAMPAVSVAPPAAFFSPHPASTTRAAAIKRVLFIVAPDIGNKWGSKSQSPPPGYRGETKPPKRFVKTNRAVAP